MHPLISIVVPVYRIDEKYLRECISSLRDQTLQEIEIILVDDGSPDRCGLICDEYAERDPRITVIHQENLGVSEARNAGMNKACAEYLMFVDGDDILKSDCCETLINFVNDSGHVFDVVYFNMHSFNENGLLHVKKSFTYEESREIHSDSFNEMKVQLLSGDFSFETTIMGGPCTKLFKTVFLRMNHISSPKGIIKSQDIIFNLYVFEKINRIYYFDYEGYFYRKHSESLCHKYNPQIIRIYTDWVHCASEYVDQYHNGDMLFEKALGKRCVQLTRVINALYSFHKDNNQTIRQISKSYEYYLKDEIVERYINRVSYSDFRELSSKLVLFLMRHKCINAYLILAGIHRAIRI